MQGLGRVEIGVTGFTLPPWKHDPDHLTPNAMGSGSRSNVVIPT